MGLKLCIECETGTVWQYYFLLFLAGTYCVSCSGVFLV